MPENYEPSNRPETPAQPISAWRGTLECLAIETFLKRRSIDLQNVGIDGGRTPAMGGMLTHTVKCSACWQEAYFLVTQDDEIEQIRTPRCTLLDKLLESVHGPDANGENLHP